MSFMSFCVGRAFHSMNTSMKAHPSNVSACRKASLAHNYTTGIEACPAVLMDNSRQRAAQKWIIVGRGRLKLD